MNDFNDRGEIINIPPSSSGYTGPIGRAGSGNNHLLPAAALAIVVIACICALIGGGFFILTNFQSVRSEIAPLEATQEVTSQGNDYVLSFTPKPTSVSVPELADDPTVRPVTVGVPSPTSSPTSLPLQVETPQVSPTARHCIREPGPTVVGRWNPDLQRDLGCPTNEERGVITAYQAFEKGFMIWRADTRQIYAVFDNGTFSVFLDSWQEGQPEYSCANSDTLSTTPPTPRRGFGKVWCEETGIKGALGNALGDEVGDYRSLQDFEHGLSIVVLERGRSYLFFIESSRWQ